MIKVASFNACPSDKVEQLPLPFDDRPLSEVFWHNADTEVKRRWLFGKRIVKHCFIDPETTLSVMTSMQASDICKIKDPKLRYALTLQDAANAAGSFNHTPYLRSSHFVSVTATDDGTDSKFIDATYTGTTRNGIDTFMDNLKRFDPEYEGDYGSL